MIAVTKAKDYEKSYDRSFTSFAFYIDNMLLLCNIAKHRNKRSYHKACGLYCLRSIPLPQLPTEPGNFASKQS